MLAACSQGKQPPSLISRRAWSRMVAQHKVCVALSLFSFFFLLFTHSSLSIINTLTHCLLHRFTFLSAHFLPFLLHRPRSSSRLPSSVRDIGCEIRSRAPLVQRHSPISCQPYYTHSTSSLWRRPIRLGTYTFFRRAEASALRASRQRRTLHWQHESLPKGRQSQRRISCE